MMLTRGSGVIRGRIRNRGRTRQGTRARAAVHINKETSFISDADWGEEGKPWAVAELHTFQSHYNIYQKKTMKFFADAKQNSK